MPSNPRLTFFGTAAGFPTKARAHTTAIGLWRGASTSLDLASPRAQSRGGESLYLFDAGEGVASQFVRMGIAPDTLTAVFFTHPHADHMGGIAMLVQWLQLNRRRAPLAIYVPDKSLAGLMGYLHLLYLHPLTEFEIEFRPVTDGLVHHEDGLQVTAVHSHHLESDEPSRASAGQRLDSQAFSYLIAADGKTLYISGDIAGPEEAAKHADNVGTAVVELAHFTAEELGAAFSTSSLLRLILTHINDDFEPFEDEIPARLAAMGFEGDVIVATDGLEVGL
jgi:ribonuclease BN (tRNA processing enzyme)